MVSSQFWTMTLFSQKWSIVNKNLFIEGVNFSRAGHFNPITLEELYVCSEYERSKCPCTAVVRYYKGQLMRDPRYLTMMKS